jgi:hypothetical protein
MTGLTIKAKDGTVILDMTMKISQHMGSVDTNSTNGSVSIPAAPLGKTLFYNIVPLVDLQVDKGKKPGVTISGVTLSWAYSFNTGGGWGYFAANCRIYYGFY